MKMTKNWVFYFTNLEKKLKKYLIEDSDSNEGAA